MKPRLVITVGIPAAGKSTLRPKLLEGMGDACIVSPDEIRFKMLKSETTGVYFNPKIEGFVWQRAFSKMKKCMEEKKDILFDATSVNVASRKKVIDQVDRTRYSVEAAWIKIDPALALLRNSKRPRKVEPSVICDKFKKFQEPTKEEGFSKISIHLQVPSKEEEKELRSMKDDFDCDKILAK